MHATFTDFILVFFSLSLFPSQKNSTKFLSYLVLFFKALLTMGRYPNIKINASRTFQNIFIRPSGSQRRAGESQKGFMAPPGFWRFSWIPPPGSGRARRCGPDMKHQWNLCISSALQKNLMFQETKWSRVRRRSSLWDGRNWFNLKMFDPIQDPLGIQ